MTRRDLPRKSRRPIWGFVLAGGAALAIGIATYRSGANHQSSYREYVDCVSRRAAACALPQDGSQATTPAAYRANYRNQLRVGAGLTLAGVLLSVAGVVVARIPRRPRTDPSDGEASTSRSRGAATVAPRGPAICDRCGAPVHFDQPGSGVVDFAPASGRTTTLCASCHHDLEKEQQWRKTGLWVGEDLPPSLHNARPATPEELARLFPSPSSPNAPDAEGGGTDRLPR
jgi:hypothetical protein